MPLHIADFVMLVGYFALVLLIGAWSARQVSSMGDFVLPRRFGKLTMAFFAFGTGTRADDAVSVAAKTYTSGASGIWYQWLWLPVTPFYWLIAPVMSRFRAITTADIFELRFGGSVAVLFAAIGLLQNAVNIGVMLKGSSAMIDASTGGVAKAEWMIPAMTVMFVAYGVAGGLHAAVITDLVQGILTVIFSFMLLPFVLDAIGGLAALHEKLPASMTSLVAPGEISVFYVAVIAFNGLIGIVAQPHFLANCAAGRTEFDGQVGVVAGNLLKRICTIAWTLTGLAAIVYFAGIGRSDIHPDKVFGSVAFEFLPNVLPGLLGLFIAGLLASVMSTCDAIMISSSGLFTENIYKRVVPGRASAHYLGVARLASVLVVVFGLVFAYSLESVIDGLEVFWKIASLLGIAFWLGLFWRGATTAGAWAASCVAGGAMLVAQQAWFARLFTTSDWGEAANLTTGTGENAVLSLPWQMVFYLSCGIVAGIVVSWFTPKHPPELLDRFYTLIRTPVAPGERIDTPCTLPVGVTPAPPRKLFTAPSLEILRPTRQAVLGFLACWIAVFLLVASFFVLLRA